MSAPYISPKISSHLSSIVVDVKVSRKIIFSSLHNSTIVVHTGSWTTVHRNNFCPINGVWTRDEKNDLNLGGNGMKH